MANYRVRSTDGSNADDGSTWALAKADLHTATTGALAVASAAGDTIWCSQAHAQSAGAAISLDALGTAANPTKILAVNDAADPPTAMSTCSVATTSGGSYNISFTGFAYYEGITFSTAGTANASIQWTATTPWYHVHKDCAFQLGTTNTGARISIGASSVSIDDQGVEWYNCSVKFAATAQGIAPRCNMLWSGGSVDGAGTIPTSLFLSQNGVGGVVTCVGVDLSNQTGSGKNIIDVSGAGRTDFKFRNCKLGATVNYTTGSYAGPGGVTVEFINCSNGDTNYTYYYGSYLGTVQHETVVVKTSGASDGTTSISHKMTSASTTTFTQPLTGPWITVWNETTGSNVAGKIEIIHDSLTALKESEVWIEVEYLGTSGSSKSSFSTDHNSTLLSLSTTDQTSSSVAWGGSLSNPNKQSLSVTVVPQKKGPLRYRVRLAKPNYTIFYSPDVVIS